MRSFHSKIKLKSKKGSKITIANVYNPKHLKGGALNACPVFLNLNFTLIEHLMANILRFLKYL